METYLQIPFYPMPFYAISMQIFKLSIFREKISFDTVFYEYQGEKIDDVKSIRQPWRNAFLCRV